jgi:hypothetical protein
MSEQDGPTQEVITTGNDRLVLQRRTSAIEGLDVVEGSQRLICFDVDDSRIRPENYNKADGAPMRVLESGTAKLDVSKRSVHDMGFWHRSTDFSEVIICIRGALRWETELGTHILRPGGVLCIPRGIAHRSALCDESAAENVLIELKVKDDFVRSAALSD